LPLVRCLDLSARATLYYPSHASNLSDPNCKEKVNKIPSARALIIYSDSDLVFATMGHLWFIVEKSLTPINKHVY